MKRLSVFYAIILLLAISCKPGIEKTISRKGVIPEKRFIEILTELSLAEGIMYVPQLREIVDRADSLDIFTQVLENKGYTHEDLDHTLQYYFLRQPKRMAIIYDEVLKNLSEMEARVIAQMTENKEGNENLWNGKKSYFLPQDGVNEKIGFSIAISDTGTYILKTTINMYNDDMSIDPAINLYFWYDDGTPDGVSEPWPKTKILKDGQNHDYTVSARTTNMLVTHIRGYLLDHSPQPGQHWEKNVRIDRIILEKVPIEEPKPPKEKLPVAITDEVEEML